MSRHVTPFVNNESSSNKRQRPYTGEITETFNQPALKLLQLVYCKWSIWAFLLTFSFPLQNLDADEPNRAQCILV